MKEKGIPTGLPGLKYDYDGDEPDFEWYDKVPAALTKYYVDKPKEARDLGTRKEPRPPKPLVMANVWARITSYERMSQGRCTASHKRIAADIGMERSVVDNATAELVADGFLEDITPPYSRTKHYRATDKISEIREEETGNLRGYRVT